MVACTNNLTIPEDGGIRMANDGTLQSYACVKFHQTIKEDNTEGTHSTSNICPAELVPQSTTHSRRRPKPSRYSRAQKKL